MAIEEVGLRPSWQANLEAGSVGVIYVDAREGLPLTVRLSVGTDENRKYNLHIGDTFPIRDQTWKLERVDDPSSNWTVTLTRIA